MYFFKDRNFRVIRKRLLRLSKDKKIALKIKNLRQLPDDFLQNFRLRRTSLNFITKRKSEKIRQFRNVLYNAKIRICAACSTGPDQFRREIGCYVRYRS